MNITKEELGELYNFCESVENFLQVNENAEGLSGMKGAIDECIARFKNENNGMEYRIQELVMCKNHIKKHVNDLSVFKDLNKYSLWYCRDYEQGRSETYSGYISYANAAIAPIGIRAFHENKSIRGDFVAFEYSEAQNKWVQKPGKITLDATHLTTHWIRRSGLDSTFQQFVPQAVVDLPINDKQRVDFVKGVTFLTNHAAPIVLEGETATVAPPTSASSSTSQKSGDVLRLGNNYLWACLLGVFLFYFRFWKLGLIVFMVAAFLYVLKDEEFKIAKKKED